jgi:Raf kinase inhibitor-like YbhB/YbcL family protein
MPENRALAPVSVISIALLALAACSRPDRASVASADTGAGASTGARVMIQLTSSAFKNGDSIPTRFTCDGADQSPPLAWTGAPANTAAFALIVEDPDAPGGTFIHWVIYDIPASATSLPEGVTKGDVVAQLGNARQGRTGFGGSPGYGGPCPPAGPAHHYHFRLFALDRKLGLQSGASRDDVMKAMSGRELGRGELVGTYARKKQ